MNDTGLFYSPTKNKSASRKGTIHTFNNTLTMPNKPPQIEEMDNCIIVDNFLHSFDAFEEEVLKFPATNCHEINEILFYGEKEADYGNCWYHSTSAKRFCCTVCEIVYNIEEKDYMIPIQQ